MAEQVAFSGLSARPVSFRAGIYEAIRRTAEAQRQAVETDDLDRFYDLLQERERLLEKAESVQQTLEGSDRTRTAQVVQEIMRVDQETERLLMGKIDDVRIELSDMSSGRQALAAYNNNPTPTRVADYRS